MTEPLHSIPLAHRALLTVSGDDRRQFLQGLISNDVAKAGPDRAAWSALLTPQGRFLHDFFMAEIGETLILEAEAARLPDLSRRLGLYKLRSKVALKAREGWHVFALIGDGAAETVGVSPQPGSAKPFAGGFAFVDPRLAEAGLRAWLPEGAEAELAAAGFAPGASGEWDRLRLGLGLPDGSRDMEPEKALLLECGFDELGGVDWSKGCYMGQELTARTKYRGLVKKRLMPVRIEGEAPPPGTIITLDGEEAGEMRSAANGVGLAMIRLEKLADAAARDGSFTVGGAKLVPGKPGWARF